MRALVEIVRGFGVTFRYMFRKRNTIQYPEVRREVSPGYRGIPALRRYPDTGEERCVACALCVQICPARCIEMVTDTGPDGKKRPAAYKIDVGRCLYCGLCAEVCPEEAVVLSRRYELTFSRRGETLLEKEALLRGGEEEQDG